MEKVILFVYNANSENWSKYLDFAHKIINPSTYSCDLCSLTHGNFSEKKIWKTFRETVSSKMVFLYKDEFLGKYKDEQCQEFIFPIVLEQKKNKLHPLIESEELKSIQSVENLIENLKAKLI